MNKQEKIFKTLFAGILLLVVMICLYTALKKLWLLKKSHESPFDGEDNLQPVPVIFNLMYEIQTKGKEKEFPIALTKITDGEIELPFKLSLTKQDYPYRAIKIKKGDTVLAANLIEVSYTLNAQSFLHNFFVTRDGYLLSYETAENNFMIKK